MTHRTRTNGIVLAPLDSLGPGTRSPTVGSGPTGQNHTIAPQLVEVLIKAGVTLVCAPSRGQRQLGLDTVRRTGGSADSMIDPSPQQPAQRGDLRCRPSRGPGR